MRSGRSGSPGGDDFGEGGDVPATGDFEAGAEIVPEFDSELAAGLVEAEEGVAAVAADVGAGSSADLALGDLATDIVLGAVGVQRDIGPFEHFEQFALVGPLAGQQTIESGEAGLVAEDAVEPRRQDRLALRRGMAAPGLQIGVEEPDQAADASLRGALSVGERIEFVNQPFVMDPAQAVLTDVELAGVVADNDRVGEKTVGFDAAPQGAFGGDQHGIGMDLQGRDAETVEVCAPGRPIGEPTIGMLAQSSDDGSSERAGAHVGESFFVDDVIAMSGAQQFEKVEAALRERGPEPSEMGVADLGAVPVLALVPRPGVVDRDPGGVGQAGAQHVAGFIQKTLLARDQQANDLPLGDEDPEPSQHLDQPPRRDLSLMIEGEHEATQFRPEMGLDAQR